jgi:hypothetical protein
MAAITTDTDKVRFLIGDLDATDYLLDADEMTYVLATETNIYLAAIMACDAIIAKMARYIDVSMGKTKETQSQLKKHYEELRATIQLAISRGEQASLYVGQILDEEIDEDEADTDLIQPHIKVGIHDNKS